MKEKEQIKSVHPADCNCPLCAENRACCNFAEDFKNEVRGQKVSEGDNERGSESVQNCAESGGAVGRLHKSANATCACGHHHKAKEEGDGIHQHETRENGDCACGHHHEEKACYEHQHGDGDDCGCGHGHGETRIKSEKLVFFMRAGAAAILLALGSFLKLPEFWNLAFLIPAYLIIGADVIIGAFRGLFRGKVLDERLLMAIASVGAIIVSEAAEGVLVMLLYQIGEFLTDLSLERSKKSISALTKLRPEFAVVIRGGAECKVSPEEVEVGEIIIVRAGERIPLDGVMAAGKTSLDSSALTGESVPVSKTVGDEILSGAVNLDGVIQIEVTKTFGASAVMRIMEMVGEASEKKTKTERFIKKFAKYYTPAVVVAAVLLAIVPSIVTGEWARWIHTALVFLVISCPCALVIAVPLTYFAGVGGASRQGILVKGGNALDALKNVRQAVFDKTGTLTEGVFEVTAVTVADGAEKDDLKYIVSAAESLSNHPIAKSIIKEFGKPNADVSDYKEVAGKGISASVDGRAVLCGNAKLLQDDGILFTEIVSGGSVVYVAADGKYLGATTVSDRIKTDAKTAVNALKRMGISSFMLTGDREAAAVEVADALALTGYRAGLLPGDKVSGLESLMKNGKTAFVGDGVNDAPVITRADVGFAMGGMGQDAAIEAADIVIMDDNPAKVVKAVKIAKRTGRIAVENIVFALAVKAVIMVLGIAGIANMWLAVFADVGVTLIAVANAMRAYLKIK